MEKRMSGNVSHWVVLVIVAMGLQGTLALDTSVKVDNFGVLIDAGSSSSKIKIYRWNHSHAASSEPTVELIKSKKLRPAISSFSDDMEGLGTYIDSALEWIMSIVPSAKHRSTPVLVMATAGLRFLEPEKSQEIMTGVRNVLRNTSRNPLAVMEKDDVSVLSGEEEGVYAWIAANYLLGFFDGDKPNNESVGVLEMGGGSTQVVFIPEGPVYGGEFHVSDRVFQMKEDVRLAGRRYDLYVHSYLNLGASAINREIVYELMKSGTENNIAEPCMLKGDNKTVSFGQNRLINVFGSGNATACTEVLNDVLEPAKGIRCQPKPCTIRNVYQPDVGSRTFYATQTFNYAPRYLGGVRPDGTLDMQRLIEGADKLCSLSLKEAKAKRSERKKYVSSDCLMGNYIPTLLQNYRFSLDTKQIHLISTIKSQSIDWAMGAMLVKLSERFSPNTGLTVVCPARTGNDASSRNKPKALVILIVTWMVLCIL